MARLEGHIAIITGAGRKRGLGRAIALRLAQDGADVAISARASDPAKFASHERESGWRGIETLAAEIRALGRRAVAIDCDVTKPSDVIHLIDRVAAELGAPSALINNAGIAPRTGASPITDTNDEDWRQTVDVNLNGVYYVSKYGIRAMLAAGKRGAIVNISSIAGRVGFKDYGAYCATKFALIGLTQQQALELAPHGIRVNCLCPGSTDTDMMDNTFRETAALIGSDYESVRQGMRNAIPLGRQADPEEQAAVVSFLLGPDASYITGQTLNVDGGLRMD
jgi:3-oxoacyl-[acyl-carrier protein] reductase/meso-butanediol dehydrogenase/(S,S)-butanediol dehydrogenase/diacetyl reductase